MKPDVSIVIVSYNTKDLTLDCIESVSKGDSDIEKEIIVVDNASSDGTVEAIRNLKFRNRDSRKEIITNKSNLGFARANNQGIKTEKGKYILGYEGILDKYAPPGDKPVTVEVASMAAFLITPLCLKKVGLLDERYFMYFEDFDYSCRVNENGLKIYYLPAAEVVHHHGESGKDLADKQNQWRRLITSSKIYHGIIRHYFINLIIWLGQKKKKYIIS